MSRSCNSPPMTCVTKWTVNSQRSTYSQGPGATDNNIHPIRPSLRPTIHPSLRPTQGTETSTVTRRWNKSTTHTRKDSESNMPRRNIVIIATSLPASLQQIMPSSLQQLFVFDSNLKKIDTQPEELEIVFTGDSTFNRNLCCFNISWEI